MIAAWAALLRLARRDIRGSRGRAALIVALVALPVMGLVTQGTLRATVQPTPSELATRELGAANLAVYATRSGDGAIRDRLPPDVHVAPVWRGTLTLTSTAAAPRTVEALGVDLGGLGRGMVEITHGRAPRPGTDEIAVTMALAASVGLDVGDETHTDLGAARVVGLVRDPVALDRQVLVVAPERAGQPSGLLVDVPDDDAAAVARAVEQVGADAVTRRQIARPDTEQTALNLAMGGFVFLLTGFVVAAAFAVSAQRRRHDLALLAATGADARHLRRSVLATAIVLGGSGAVLGAAAGVAVSAATLPWLEQWTNRAVDGLALQPLLLVAATATGLAAAIGAAWFTARSAGRTPVAAALTGRRPPTGSSGRLFVAGVVGLALGVTVTAAATSAWATVDDVLLLALGLLAGAALVMLGLGAVSPWLVERLTALIGTRLPVAVRLALRDTARFRSRTGPIVMAIVAGLGISVAVGATLDTIETGLAADHRPLLDDDQMLVDGPAAAPLVDELRGQLPVRAAAPLTVVQPDDPTRSRRVPPVVTVADARLLDALGASRTARDAVRAGQVLVLQQRGRAAVQAAVEQAERLAPDGVHVAELELVPRAVPAIVLSRDTLDRSGARVAREGTSWLIRFAEPLTDRQIEQARELAGRAGQRVTVENGPMDVDTATIQTVALVATAVLSLLIVAVGLALIGAETRDDDAVLAAVGASPRTRRSLAAARAGVLTVLGAILAVPAGLVPVWGLSTAAGAGAASGRLTIPWSTVAAVVLLVPAIAAAGAYLCTRPEPHHTHSVPAA